MKYPYIYELQSSILDQILSRPAVSRLSAFMEYGSFNVRLQVWCRNIFNTWIFLFFFQVKLASTYEAQTSLNHFYFLYN